MGETRATEAMRSVGLKRLVRNLFAAVAAVVLLELAIQCFAPDAERAGGVRFIAGGVIERGFDRLTLDFFHRRWDSDFKRRRAAFARSLRAFDFDTITFSQRDLSDRFRQIFQLDLST